MDSFLLDLPAIASTFALAFFSFWAAIPAGLALGLSPVAVIVTTSISYASGVVLIALVGGKIRDWVIQRMSKKGDPEPAGWLRRVWDRFGMIGLGLAAPLTVGAQIGAAIGLALGAPPRRLTLAMSLGALAWSIGLTAGVSLGVMAVNG
jgi:hypothetical protein